MAKAPRVGVGVPVFNGERYLRQALESLVGQSFTDLEITIVDNASNDATASIAQSFAAADPRVRYRRNATNLGIARNFNRAFEVSRGEYFKWASHDDLCLPTFVERCVDALDRDPKVVLAYPSPLDIDADDTVIGPRDAGLDFTKDTPFERFRDQMIKAHAGLHLYGLIRADALRRTGLHGLFHGGDRVLLSELALQGKFIELPDQLYLHREHADRLSYDRPSLQEIMRNYEPGRYARPTFPVWRMLHSYLAAVRRAPIGTQEKMRCAVQMLGWSKGMRHELVHDLSQNLRQVRTGRS
jgi:glycosyltransferase involved in cell wall biosynthesis